MSPMDFIDASASVSANDVSYVSGTSSRQLLGITIGDALDNAVRPWGERTALVVRHQDIRWSYRELAEHVDAFVGVAGPRSIAGLSGRCGPMKLAISKSHDVPNDVRSSRATEAADCLTSQLT